MYACSSDDIWQYALSSSWDLSTAAYDSKTYATASQDGQIDGLFVMSGAAYIAGQNTDTAYQYTLTGWDIDTASYASKSVNFSTKDNDPNGMDITSGGMSLLIGGEDNKEIYQFNMTQPFDLSTATPTGMALNVSAVTAVQLRGFVLGNSDGNLYVCASASVYQYRT